MTREEFEAIVKEINESKCSSVLAVRDTCELFHKAKPTRVMRGLDVDKHRWYEISTDVYCVCGWFLGVRGVSDLFSETMVFSDCDIDTEAFEMEEVETKTYRQKK